MPLARGLHRSRTLARSKRCWSCCAIYSVCGNTDRTKNGGKQARICSADAAAKPAYCAPRWGRSCRSDSLHDAFVSSATAQPCPARWAVQHLAAAAAAAPPSRSLCWSASAAMSPAPKTPCAPAYDSRRGRQVAQDCTPHRQFPPHRLDRCVVPPNGLARAHPRFPPSSTGAAGGPRVCQPDQQRHRQLHRSPHACCLLWLPPHGGAALAPAAAACSASHHPAHPARMHSRSEGHYQSPPFRSRHAHGCADAGRGSGGGGHAGAGAALRLAISTRRQGWSARPGKKADAVEAP